MKKERNKGEALTRGAARDAEVREIPVATLGEEWAKKLLKEEVKGVFEMRKEKKKGGTITWQFLVGDKKVLKRKQIPQTYLFE